MTDRRLLDRRLLASPFLAEPMAEVFSERAQVQAMLDFEAALVRAEADAGVIPRAVAAAILPQCRAQLFNFDALAEGMLTNGDVAARLVKTLADRVARKDPTAARYVNWGATSQDVVDTALVLELRAALDFFEQHLGRLNDELARLASKHKHTIMLGRTFLQPAEPITFGLKAAGWLSAMDRARQRLQQLHAHVLVVQFGGSVGTLASLGARRLEVAIGLARELRLALPDLPWHTQRDRVAEVGAALGLLAGSIGKVARDVSLMLQGEAAEVSEGQGPGHGERPSTALHRRVPIGIATMLAAATCVPGQVATLFSALPQEHERGLGGWQAEWETLPEICIMTASSLLRAIELVEGLEVDAERMRRNLDATRSTVMIEPLTVALAEHMGRSAATLALTRACRVAKAHDWDLRDALSRDAEVTSHLSEREIERLLDPAAYLGLSEQWIERVLETHATRGTSKPASFRRESSG